MDFKLLPVTKDDIAEFKRDMQEAFQMGAAAEYPHVDEEILPESDIDESLSKKGAFAYKAVLDGKMTGGVIVVINSETQHNDLDFLYVKYGEQSRGIGQKIWNEVENLYPDTRVWETCTPYFEKRNIHFYINCLGFRAVEFYNPHHKDPNESEEMENMVGGDYFFKFEKEMKRTD